MVKVGIIGGSGLDDPNLLKDYSEIELNTKYGSPSSKITHGKLRGADVYILARHGKKHDIPPSEVNFQGNIYALKELGCDYIFATTAVGSLRAEIKPGNLVFPNQVIDFTKKRKNSFYSEVGNLRHTPMSEPFSKKLRDLFSNVCNELNINYNRDKTLITIEGPRFSTKAESIMFRQFGADMINMSTCPEVFLANELGIPYQAIAMSTDYDCWKDDEEPVNFDMILKIMNENSEKVKRVIIRSIEKLVSEDTDYIKSKIRTIPNWPKQGVMFRDITTLMQDPIAMEKTIDLLSERYKGKNIDVVAGIESRGFIFVSALAYNRGVSFVPLRKKGKLPYKTVSEEYDLEYGKDVIEIHEDAIKQGEKVVLVDDLIATGGTALAGCRLINKLGGKIEECCFVIDLPSLGGKKKLEANGFKAFNLIDFEGD